MDTRKIRRTIALIMRASIVELDVEYAPDMKISVRRHRSSIPVSHQLLHSTGPTDLLFEHAGYADSIFSRSMQLVE